EVPTNEYVPKKIKSKSIEQVRKWLKDFSTEIRLKTPMNGMKLLQQEKCSKTVETVDTEITSLSTESRHGFLSGSHPVRFQ
ncbi:unnamed protein product, partial [Allacma fusca]